MLKFAELKRFENMNLMNFSSGMYVRLAFSTAIQTDPDVLLVDEVLAVGDEASEEDYRAGFACAGDVGTVRGLCEGCVLLDGGWIAYMGETDGVPEAYLRMTKAGGG